jgi:hypothetical protein
MTTMHTDQGSYVREKTHSNQQFMMAVVKFKNSCYEAFCKQFACNYDLCVKTRFGSSFLPVVCRRANVLFTLFVFVCI